MAAGSATGAPRSAHGGLRLRLRCSGLLSGDHGRRAKSRKASGGGMFSATRSSTVREFRSSGVLTPRSSRMLE
eukprot:1598027-Pyramimonas_sp.AAC.2